MGKLEDDHEVLIHFSHKHPLEFLNLEVDHTSRAISCSGCNLKASGWIYGCKACNYFLHKSCSMMPRQLHHPADPIHALTLLSSPIYREGLYKCNACGRNGKGFCFHCKECKLDIHILCAFRPKSVDHVAHHHSLNLCFSPPYRKKGFRCNICKESGSNHWLYRCDSCNFDAHMNCATVKTQSQPSSSTQQQQQRHQQQQLKAGIGFPNGYQENCHFPQQQQQQMKAPCISQPQYQVPGIAIPNGYQANHHFPQQQQQQNQVPGIAIPNGYQANDHFPQHQQQQNQVPGIGFPNGYQENHHFPQQQQQQNQVPGFGFPNGHQENQYFPQQQQQQMKVPCINQPQYQVPRIAIPNGYQANHHSPQQQQQQMKAPFINQPQYQIPGIAIPNGSVPTSVVPPFMPSPRTNTLGINLMGHMAEGIMDSFTQQIGQTVIPNILGGASDPSSLLDFVGSGLISSLLNN